MKKVRSASSDEVNNLTVLGDVQLFVDDNVLDEKELDEDLTDEVINKLSSIICSKPPHLSPHY